MGCLFSTERENVTITVNGKKTISEETSFDKIILSAPDTVLKEETNKRSWPELVGKDKQYVLSYFEINHPKLIVKFDDEMINPYLSNETYEMYDILITVKNNIVSETPVY